MAKKLIILSGLSGSGNTSIMQELLDLNYMILSSLESDKFYNIIKGLLEDSKNNKIAINLNVQDEQTYNSNYSAIKKIKKEFSNIQILQVFLTCQSEVLSKRYQENRKIHPFIKNNKLNIDIEDVITEEVKITQEFKGDSDFIIDTSQLVVRDAKNLFKNFIDEDSKFTINLISSGFKYGEYTNSDFMFDLRFLPNPFYEKNLKLKTGKDKEVEEYVFKTKEAMEMYDHILGIINLSIKGYEDVGKKSLTISLVCTGGQHRSVSFVQRLNEELAHKYNTYIMHLEEVRGHWNG